jgi:hypothetical protein
MRMEICVFLRWAGNNRDLALKPSQKVPKSAKKWHSFCAPLADSRRLLKGLNRRPDRHSTNGGVTVGYDRIYRGADRIRNRSERTQSPSVPDLLAHASHPKSARTKLQCQSVWDLMTTDPSGNGRCPRRRRRAQPTLPLVVDPGSSYPDVRRAPIRAGIFAHAQSGWK